MQRQVGAYNTLVKRKMGANWQLINGRLDNPNGFHLNAIATQGDNVFIAGEAGTAYASQDGGASWSSVAPPYDGSLFGAHFDANGRVWLYGLRGNIYYSDDLGDRYQAIDSTANDNLSGGFSDANGYQWLVGNSGAIVEIDPQLNTKQHTHPSNSVITDIIADGDEKILTGRSGLMYWPARISEDSAELAAQGAQ